MRSRATSTGVGNGVAGPTWVEAHRDAGAGGGGLAQTSQSSGQRGLLEIAGSKSSHEPSGLNEALLRLVAGLLDEVERPGGVDLSLGVKGPGRGP